VLKWAITVIKLIDVTPYLSQISIDLPINSKVNSFVKRPYWFLLENLLIPIDSISLNKIFLAPLGISPEFFTGSVRFLNCLQKPEQSINV